MSTIKQIGVMLCDFVKENDKVYTLSLWFNDKPEVRKAVEDLCILTSAIHTVTDSMYGGEMLVSFTIPKLDPNDLNVMMLHLNTDPLLWDNLHMFLKLEKNHASN